MTEKHWAEKQAFGPDERFDAAFLGPMAENAALLESLVVDALRDHAYWRRNFHPEDSPHISQSAPMDAGYQQFVARTRQVLHRLAGDLKRSVPWFSPRYIGHMASDLLLPGVVARILATLYNPNNVSEDASGPLVRLELEVGEELCRMVGYDAAVGAEPRAWGHLTSGGTVANIEALWNLRAAQMLGPALAEAARQLELPGLHHPLSQQPLEQCDAWSLINLRVQDALAFRRAAFAAAFERGGDTLARELHEHCEALRVETVGMRGFLEHYGLNDPVVVAPHSAHYSWSRAVKLLGLGSNALAPVATDAHLRMDAEDLVRVLDGMERERRPVLAVVGVLGTTEFGTLDPIHRIVDERDERAQRGQGFGVHIDAAWGGYLASVFRQEDGSFLERAVLRETFRYFPSQAVYSAFAAMGRADSITVDPHKLGFIPYPAGAFLARDREIAGLLAESAPYVFDDKGAPPAANVDHLQLGKYILEGSKPGSSAASVHATHAVLPLHQGAFGQLIGRTIRATEELYDRLRDLRESLGDVALLEVPFEPDSNIVCLVVNPAGNRDLGVMNDFMRQLFERMRFRPHAPLQTHDFIGSFTSVSRSRLSQEHWRRLCESVGIDDTPQDDTPRAGQQEHLFLLRHTLMNPWLMDGSPAPLDLYVEFLEAEVRSLCEK